ncbi:hypothetical protein SAMN06264364_12282 [Quadrisphaera granulorum]|uniref:Uncharacterized protein n=1 Tax=Quadrisphaera granulorum TaxID=317664 RepID=A0A315ZYF1_9ACTN|nr:hypothetical protein BXY45_12282 [Quadrisphaera granulorum]SZE97954.1 hypothetical protein SAMN06264364_12282 [Quadrisphaera granulorum]
MAEVDRPFGVTRVALRVFSPSCGDPLSVESAVVLLRLASSTGWLT